jgi:deazaflavin-dependent oxidoreductase (nitroreductase family)
VPSDLAMKTMNIVHRIILRVTGNRVGWSAMNMPVLELTTVGRKSGKPRTVLLTSPLLLGDSLVVVASRGGDDDHPAWFLNLRDNPEVRVSIQGGDPIEMLARVTGREERARLWPRVVADHGNYGDYQAKTSREIPLVVLDPVQENQPGPSAGFSDE